MVAVLQPPKPVYLNPIQGAKDTIQRQLLKEIENSSPNIKIWDNPLQTYDEDDGRHPSPEQTMKLLQFINNKSQQDMGVPIFLPSGPNDYMVSSKKYGGVRSLYKYGCGGCADRSRNKWWGLCTVCSEQAMVPQDHGLSYEPQIFKETVERIKDSQTPPLNNSSTGKDRDRSPLKSSSSSGDSDSRKKPKITNSSVR